MKVTAVRMICGLVAVGILIAVISDNPVPVVVTVAVSCVVWRVAKGFPKP